MSNKPTTFRPSEKALQRIKETMKEKGYNRNQAINSLLEDTSQPQLEHSERGTFLDLPPFLRCQDTETSIWLPTKECMERCKTCNLKKLCEAWIG